VIDEMPTVPSNPLFALLTATAVGVPLTLHLAHLFADRTLGTTAESSNRAGRRESCPPALASE